MDVSATQTRVPVGTPQPREKVAEPAVPYRNEFTRVLGIETGIAAFVFVAIVLLAGFALWRYRARRVHKPTRKHESTLVEGSYVLVVLCVAVFIVWLSLTSNSTVRAATAKKPALVVKVTAFQWCWRFTYVHQGDTVQGTCNEGRTLPTLVVPTGERIKFEIESNDVVHEFWLPYLDYKVEAFPDHVNAFTATFTQDGRWEGHCSEFCGLYHDDMLFWVHAESASSFHTWLSAHKGLHIE